jgi:CDP-diacylglycerol---glycerol-3-phosphate 3-phosphatidyltransferase
MSMANIITLSRLPLLLVFLVLLLSPSILLRITSIFLLVILFLMDWFDGYVARRRHEVTELGAVLDVALDRAVENILWVAFLFIHLVPLWVPILFLCRSFIVDSLRGIALRQGQSVFGMMHSSWGKFLVASRFMRALYGFAKAWVFCQLTLTYVMSLQYSLYLPQLEGINQILIYFVSALCLARGIPVLFDSRIYLSQNPTRNL